jgi:hypothetical protein
LSPAENLIRGLRKACCLLQMMLSHTLQGFDIRHALSAKNTTVPTRVLRKVVRLAANVLIVGLRVVNILEKLTEGTLSTDASFREKSHLTSGGLRKIREEL